MYIVTQDYLGNIFYLRATVWTSEQERANEFTTQDEAQEALNRAKKFMKAAQAKKTAIVKIN